MSVCLWGGGAGGATEGLAQERLARGIWPGWRSGSQAGRQLRHARLWGRPAAGLSGQRMCRSRRTCAIICFTHQGQQQRRRPAAGDDGALLAAVAVPAEAQQQLEQQQQMVEA